MIALAFAALIAGAPADEPRQLKCAFKPGERFKYVYTATLATKKTKGGKKILDGSVESKVALECRVASVSKSGVADVGYTMTRIRVIVKDGETEVERIDSSDEDLPAQSKAKVEPLLNEEILCKIDQYGEVSDVRLPPRIKNRPKPPNPTKLGALAENWPELVVRGLSITLPKKPIATGGQWDSAASDRYSFEGLVEEDGRRFLKVVTTSSFLLKKGGDGKKPNAEAVILLDPKTCRLVDFDGDFQGTTIEGEGANRTETELVMNLTVRLKEPAKTEPSPP